MSNDMMAKASDCILVNARLVLADRVIERGWVAVSDGLIAEFGEPAVDRVGVVSLGAERAGPEGRCCLPAFPGLVLPPLREAGRVMLAGFRDLADIKEDHLANRCLGNAVG